jgi:uncharacterized membrane protein
MTQNPSDVPPPPPSSPPPVAGGPSSGTSTGLDPRLSSLLAYLFWIVGGILFLAVEKQHQLVRFHAAQSVVLAIAEIAVWVVLFVLSLILGAIPVIGWIISFLAHIAFMIFTFVLWIFMMYKGYQLERFKLPLVGTYAEQLAAKQF